MQTSKGPAPAGPFRVLCLVLAVATAACANPFAPDVPDVSSEPLPGLSERPSGEATIVPEAAALDSSPVTTPPGAGTATTTTVGGTSAPTTAAGSPSAPTTTAGARSAAPRATVDPTKVDDAGGDAGIGAPSYADARLLFVEDLGDNARVTVRMAAALPTTLAPKEVIGIGVDFHRTGGGESDYQLFADGGSDGWRAYLQTPEGFVKYDGAFRLSGDSVQFEVPWGSIGGPPTGAVKAFADWGRPNVAGVVVRSADALPDRGTSPLGG